ncbi:hypothetical protein PIROE2DRAFT_58066 [Piromyces sp. E2]|nr:hypothetical protein PIROE2DRAFT_58066 [Piromyces sp. E2]|eukprot:OUM68528.1 hypothetical protein PIROE2DRAFT_58066 [Piromyces sp. E2]
MLLNNYTKEKGQSYLVETLEEPMKKVLPMVYKCEIDPLKIENQIMEKMKEKKKELIGENNNENELNNDTNNNEITKEEEINNEEVKKQAEEILKENTQNIQKSCTLLLKAITTSKKIMPSGFKSICQSLAYVIQKIYEEDNFFFSPNMLYVFDEEIYIRNIDDTSSMASEGIKPLIISSSDDEDNADYGNIKRKKSKTKNSNSKRSTVNLSINTKNLRDSYHSSNGNDNYSSKTSHSSELNDIYTSKTTTSIYLNKIRVQTPVYGSFDSYSDSSSDLSSSESENSSSTLSCSSIKLFIPSYEEKSAGNYFICDNDFNNEMFENNSDTKEESYHADEESSIQSLIIGTLLFLRFFIPAITSPDIYKIVPNKLSMDYRRGLILCGKVLTAMCNDVEFGGKEQYMTCFNNFLHEKKFDLQEFIAWTILPNKNDKDEITKESIPQNAIQLKNETTNSIFNSTNLFIEREKDFIKSLNFSKLNLNSPLFEQEKSPQITISPYPEPNGIKKVYKNNNKVEDDKDHYKDEIKSISPMTRDSNEILSSKYYEKSNINRKQSYESESVQNINNSNYSITSPLKVKTKLGNDINFYTTPLNSAIITTNNNNQFSPVSYKSYVSLNSGVYNSLIYGDREVEHEHDIEGFFSPVNAEYMYTFSPRSTGDNADAISFTSRMSKVAYTNQSICTPTNILLSDNCPYEYSNEIKGLDEIIDFIAKKFLRVDEEMHFFISNLKAFKEKQLADEIYSKFVETIQLLTNENMNKDSKNWIRKFFGKKNKKKDNKKDDENS